jgi:hypothetical protein
MKIVINKCCGGFGLSEVALTRYKNESGNVDVSEYYINRADPILVSIVEELEEDSWGRWAELGVVDIPNGVDWYIDEGDDGKEWVAEVHRTWE